MGEEVKAASESRVRMNLAQGAKGYVKFDVTAEFPTAVEAAAELAKAIDLVRNICAEKGLKTADAA